MLRFQILVPFIHEKKKRIKNAEKRYQDQHGMKNLQLFLPPPPAPPTPPVVRAAADGKIKK